VSRLSLSARARDAERYREYLPIGSARIDPAHQRKLVRPGVDANGQIQSTNPAVERLFVYPGHVLIGVDIGELIDAFR
jgi:PAS domain-containing protein